MMNGHMNGHTRQQQQQQQAAVKAHPLLNFNQNVPFNVAMLDQLIAQFFNSLAPAPPATQQVLVLFQNHPLAWTRAASIITQAKNYQTRVLGVNILSNTVQKRWNLLHKKQQQNIRQFVISLVIRLSSASKAPKETRLLVRKLNLVIIEVLYQSIIHTYIHSLHTLIACTTFMPCTHAHTHMLTIFT